jgi:hypothetical protein
MNADQLLQRARWGFRGAIAVALLLIGGSTMLAGSPSPGVAGGAFFAGWQLLLVGLLGRGLADCAEAICAAVRPCDPAPAPKPEPPDPAITAVATHPDLIHAGQSRPPVRR